MFTLELSDTYYREVTLHLADEDGRTKAFTFDVQFKRLSTDEHAALMKRVADERMSDAQVAAEIVVGWRKVFTGQGVPRPFTPEALQLMLQINGAGTAICKSYLDSVAQVGRGN